MVIDSALANEVAPGERRDLVRKTAVDFSGQAFGRGRPMTYLMVVRPRRRQGMTRLGLTLLLCALA